MPTRRQRPISQVRLPLYGMNDQDETYVINDFEASYMQNMEIQENVLVSRLGFNSIDDATASGAILNMYEYRKSDGNNYFLRQRGAVIEEYNEGTNAWDALSLAISISATKKISFATLNNLCIFSNGEDNDQKYDGTTVTELASNPKAEVQIVFQNRLVKLDFTSSKLSFSNINDPETFGASDFHLIDPNNASLGAGVGELNGQVVVFKENKKYIVTQLVGATIYPLDGEQSTVSHYSIASTGSSLIFLDYSGWYELRGGVTRLISDHIKMSNLDASRLGNAHAIYFDNKYRCFVTESAFGYNNREYVINTNVPTIFPENPFAITMNLINGNCYSTRITGSNQKLYFGDSRPNAGSPVSTYGKTYLMDSTMADDGATIPAFWETKLFDGGTPFYSKKYKKAHVRLENQAGLVAYVAYRFNSSGGWSETAITVNSSLLTWIMDDASEITTWSEGYGFPYEDVTDQFIPIQNVGRPRTIQFRYRNNDDDAQAKWIYASYRYRIRDKYK